MKEENPHSKKPLSDEERKKRQRILQKKKQREQLFKARMVFSVSVVVVIATIVFGISTALKSTTHSNPGSSHSSASHSPDSSGNLTGSSEESETAPTSVAQNEPVITTSSSSEEEEEELIRQADRLAASYDYDAAMDLLKNSSGYETNQAYQDKVAEYQATKDTCVAYPIDQITHIFYHTLIKDPSLAFDGDSDAGGYNQVMTTIEEFNKITQSMYEKGFVLVTLEDIAKVDEQGIMTPQTIMLPPGKKTVCPLPG